MALYLLQISTLSTSASMLTQHVHSHTQAKAMSTVEAELSITCFGEFADSD